MRHRLPLSVVHVLLLHRPIVKHLHEYDDDFECEVAGCDAKHTADYGELDELYIQGRVDAAEMESDRIREEGA